MKKLLSLFIVFMLLFMTTTIILAGNGNNQINGLGKNAEIVEQIAAGDDYLVGGGVPFEGAESESPGDISIQWAAGGVNHTHQYLTSRALTILKNDKGDKTANMLIKYSNIILSNSDWPDSYENDSGLYIGHFYNPNTGKTLFALSSPTALSRFLDHTQKAKKYYAKNKDLSMQELGRALHYLADINTPHHAALLTVLYSNHTTFEKFADTTRVNYFVDTTNKYSGLTSKDAKKDLNGYSKEILNLSAKHALEYKSQATSASVDDMQIAAKATMEYSQEIMAAYLYNFLRSVKAVK